MNAKAVAAGGARLRVEEGAGVALNAAIFAGYGEYTCRPRFRPVPFRW